MFRLDRMSLVQILVLREDAVRIAHDLALQEVLHIVDQDLLYGGSDQAPEGMEERVEALGSVSVA